MFGNPQVKSAGGLELDALWEVLHSNIYSKGLLYFYSNFVKVSIVKKSELIEKKKFPQTYFSIFTHVRRSQ